MEGEAGAWGQCRPGNKWDGAGVGNERQVGWGRGWKWETSGMGMGLEMGDKWDGAGVGNTDNSGIGMGLEMGDK